MLTQTYRAARVLFFDGGGGNIGWGRVKISVLLLAFREMFVSLRGKTIKTDVMHASIKQILHMKHEGGMKRATLALMLAAAAAATPMQEMMGAAGMAEAQTAEANVNAGIAAANQIVGFLRDGITKFQVNK